ncbi:DUF2848 domain-containing protein [Arenibaculum pallidiluteum]|uniref:DUF2848 domain-containing protein n=1 Tax=Arenibaculum pallidiluteum TaxID=2812559 RepID=UPI001A95C6DB|nr:DUF2848 domain-containing protein [Arenibaculum pallidiluteum]
MHTVDLRLAQDGTPVRAEIKDLVIAGWAGRDMAAVEHHIEELAALGVPRPSTVPLFYRVGTNQLTTAAEIDVLGPGSSGEAEAVVLSLPGGMYVGIGSDHTDRDVESYSVAVSKQMCPKPIGPELWPLDEVAAHWDRLELRSWAVIGGERVLYQEGAVAGLRDPRDLIARHAGAGGLPVGTAMFCGTLAAIGGIRPAERFEMELRDPVLGRALRHAYAMRCLPIVS